MGRAEGDTQHFTELPRDLTVPQIYPQTSRKNPSLALEIHCKYIDGYLSTASQQELKHAHVLPGCSGCN